jgi:hypothetical protein
VHELTRNLELIRNAWRKLELQWQTSSDSWRDEVQRRFEREFQEEFARLVPVYLKKLEDTSDLIDKARRALEY